MKRALMGLWVACCLTGVVHANNDDNPATVALPQVLHYEGSVSAQGAPYTGELDMRFSLLVGPKDDLEPVWTETWDAGTRRVAVEAGRFRVNLGTHEAIPALVWDAGDAYLKIAVRRPGAGDFTALAGQHRVATVPGALWSARAKDLGVTGAVQVAGATYAETLEADRLQAGGAITAGAASLTRVETPEAGFRTLNVNALTVDAGTLDGLAIAAGNLDASRITTERLYLSDGIDADARLNFYYLGGAGARTQLFFFQQDVLHLSYTVLPFTTVRVAADAVRFTGSATGYGSLFADQFGDAETTEVTVNSGGVFASTAQAGRWTTERLRGNECSICVRMVVEGQATHSCTPLEANGRAVTLRYNTSRNGQNTGLGFGHVCQRRYRVSNSGGDVPGL